MIQCYKMKTDGITGNQPTPKQLEVLMLLNPFEKKTNYAEIAKTLGVSRSAIQKRMCRFKKKCPSAHQKLRDLRKMLNRKPIVKNISSFCADEEQNECFNILDIQETF